MPATPHSSPLSLAGRQIVVTRPYQPEADFFEQQLQSWGASVHSIPMVEIRPVPLNWVPKESFDWIFFTSKNAVQHFFSSEVASLSLLQQARIAVIGPATAAMVSTYSRSVDFVSDRFDAASTAQAFSQAETRTGLRILWPCGNLADERFAEILTEAQFQVTPLIVYETCLRQELRPQEQLVLTENPLDLVVFTSPSAITAFCSLHHAFNFQIQNAAIACLGPKTAKAALYHLKRVDIEADPHTLQALAEGIYQFYTGYGSTL